MRRAEVPLEQLLPIDAEVQWHGVQMYVDALGRQEQLKAVRTLPYPENDSEAQILLDGHHTAKASRIGGLAVVRADIITSDEELAAYISSERRWWPWTSLGTMASLRAYYRVEWTQRMAHHGIATIDDVPEVILEPRSYRRPHDLRSVPVDRNGRRIVGSP